jgi:hypothetical protein
LTPPYAPKVAGNTPSKVHVDESAAASRPGPDNALPPPPSDAPAPGRAIRFPGSTARWVAALVIIVVVGVGSYVETGGHLFPNVPPEGTIWFGTSFDPDSFDLRGRLTSVGPDEEFVMVGRLPRPMVGSRLVIRSYLDDALIMIAWTTSLDEGATWGFNLGPISMPGTWRYEIAEAGGNALASGLLEATQ